MRKESNQFEDREDRNSDGGESVSGFVWIADPPDFSMQTPLISRQKKVNDRRSLPLIRNKWWDGPVRCAIL